MNRTAHNTQKHIFLTWTVTQATIIHGVSVHHPTRENLPRNPPRPVLMTATVAGVIVEWMPTRYSSNNIKWKIFQSMPPDMHTYWYIYFDLSNIVNQTLMPLIGTKPKWKNSTVCIRSWSFTLLIRTRDLYSSAIFVKTEQLLVE